MSGSRLRLRSALYAPASRPESAAEAAAQRPRRRHHRPRGRRGPQWQGRRPARWPPPVPGICGWRTSGSWRSSCASTAVDTEWFEDDMAEALVPELTGVVVPMLESAAAVEARGRAAGGGRPARRDGGAGDRGRGGTRCTEILRPPVVAAYFGAEDYIADMGGCAHAGEHRGAVRPVPRGGGVQAGGRGGAGPGGGGAARRGGLHCATPGRVGRWATRASSASIRRRCRGRTGSSAPSAGGGGPGAAHARPLRADPAHGLRCRRPSRAK